MTRLTNKMIRLAALFAIAAANFLTCRAQTVATWTGGGGNNNWNNLSNWDIGVPAEGTNALISPGFVVDYNLPMAAGSLGGVNNGGTLNINAAGFVIDTGGTNDFVPAPLVPLTLTDSALLNVNDGGSVLVTNSGAITLGINSGLAVDLGGVVRTTNTLSADSLIVGPNGRNNGASNTINAGTVVLAGRLSIRGGQSSGNIPASTVTLNGGSLVALGGTEILNSQDDARTALVVNGGTANLGDFLVQRSSGNGGLQLINGRVTATSMRIGTGVAAATSTIIGGVLTNTGILTIADRTNAANSGTRSVFLNVRGGEVYSTSAAGIVINNQAEGDTSNLANIGGTLDMTGGTLTAEAIYVNGPNVLSNANARLQLGGTGSIYLGGGGLVANASGPNMTATVTLSGGTLGAKADWSSAANVTLSGSANLKTADAGNVAHDIALSGVLSGSSFLNKIGGGKLTLGGANTYSGVTTVNEGVLALGAAGSISNSPSIMIGSGATFDVSAVSGGYVLNASRTLGGFGTVAGNVSAAAASIINPGINVVAGTLTCANSLTQAGGAFTHFDLSANPSGPDNDLVMVSGDLNIGGVNTIEVVGGGAPGSVHPLFQYGGIFNGTIANFSLSGASGSLSNNSSLKTVYLIVAAAIRAPTNVVWVGNSLVNDWDTVNRTNWLNAGALDFFVSGDNVLFDATGAAHPNVNIVGNVSPASTTVGAAANYTFSGGGNLTGTGGLTKTNTGTLTILTTNAYTGVTTIGGGVLEVSSLALGGGNSSLGAASVDPNNLVIDGGTLRYLGGSVTTDRGMTINSGGATIDVATNDATLTASGVLNGSGALTKAGPGTLALAGANGYSGGTVVNQGRFQVNASTSAGTGSLTNSSAALRVQGALVLDNIVDFEGNCALEFNGVGGNNVALRGAWVGGGTVNVYFITANASQTFTIGGAGSGGGHLWDFTGTVDFGTNSGFLRINNDNSTFNFGSSNATFNVGTGSGSLNQRNGGTTTHLGALLGGPGTKLVGRGNTGAAGITTYAIGARNLSTVFEGSITNGGTGTTASPTAITKVGTGKLTLTGISSHTGDTIVSEGTLEVDGAFDTSPVALTASPVTVNGGTLSGNGLIAGTVNVNSGGTLSPGASVGILTISNALSFQPGSTNIMELDQATGTNDAIVGLASVTYGGTLIVTNMAGTLAANDTFKLFDAPPGNYFGAFDTILLPAVAAPLVWDTSGLTLDGTIKLLVPLVLRPTISTATIEGTDFVLRGTNNGNSSTDYYVLTSTNVAAPLASWTAMATNPFESDGTFALTNAFNQGTPQRYYLLKTP